MRGVNSRLLNRLGDIRINPGKFVFADGNIDASQKVVASATAFQLNVAYWVILSPRFLFSALTACSGSALRISIVNLIIRVFVIYIQISVSEYGNEADFPCFQVDAANHVNV